MQHCALIASKFRTCPFSNLLCFRKQSHQSASSLAKNQESSLVSSSPLPQYPIYEQIILILPPEQTSNPFLVITVSAKTAPYFNWSLCVVPFQFILHRASTVFLKHTSVHTAPFPIQSPPLLSLCTQDATSNPYHDRQGPEWSSIGVTDFFCKGQRVNTLDSVNYTASATTTQVYQCNESCRHYIKDRT